VSRSPLITQRDISAEMSAAPESSREELLLAVSGVEKAISLVRRDQTAFLSLCRKTDWMIYWADKLFKEEPYRYLKEKSLYLKTLTASAVALRSWCRDLANNGVGSKDYSAKTRDLSRSLHYVNKYLVSWFLVLGDRRSAMAIIRFGLDYILPNFPMPRSDDMKRKQYLAQFKELRRWADELKLKYDEKKFQRLFAGAPDATP